MDNLVRSLDTRRVAGDEDGGGRRLVVLLVVVDMFLLVSTMMTWDDVGEFFCWDMHLDCCARTGMVRCVMEDGLCGRVRRRTWDVNGHRRVVLGTRVDNRERRVVVAGDVKGKCRRRGRRIRRARELDGHRRVLRTRDVSGERRIVGLYAWSEMDRTLEGLAIFGWPRLAVRVASGRRLCLILLFILTRHKSERSLWRWSCTVARGLARSNWKRCVSFGSIQRRRNVVRRARNHPRRHVRRRVDWPCGALEDERGEDKWKERLEHEKRVTEC